MLVIGAGRNLICHFYNCYLIALLCEQISCFQAGHAGADHCNLFSFQFYAAIENLCYGADTVSYTHLDVYKRQPLYYV